MANSSFAITVDELTLARARKGDKKAMEQLYRTFSGPVYTLAFRICGTGPDAEDVVQDCFMEVFRKLGQFRGDAPFWGWLRRVAVNKALMQLRQKSSGTTPLDDFRIERELAESVTRIHDPSDLIDLEKRLGKLSDTARAVLWLHDVEGYTHGEIATLMGKSESFSKSQLSRAYDKLRHWLKWQDTTTQDTRIRRSS